jgi:hypothetical protein
MNFNFQTALPAFVFLMPNNFRKYPLKQEQFKDFQVLLYKLKDFRGLEFLFPNSRTFKDFQVCANPGKRSILLACD